MSLRGRHETLAAFALLRAQSMRERCAHGVRAPFWGGRALPHPRQHALVRIVHLGKPNAGGREVAEEEKQAQRLHRMCEHVVAHRHLRGNVVDFVEVVSAPTEKVAKGCW